MSENYSVEPVQKATIKTIEEISLSALDKLVRQIGLGAYESAKPALVEWATAFGTQQTYQEYARNFAERAAQSTGRAQQIIQRFSEEAGRLADSATANAIEAGNKAIKSIETSAPSVLSKATSVIGQMIIGGAGNVFEGTQKIDEIIKEAELSDKPSEQVASELAGAVVGAGVTAAGEFLYASKLLGGLSLLAKVRKLTWSAVLLEIAWGAGWKIGTWVNDNFLSSRTFTERRDPLALDLDGDGLETTGISGSHPTQFDHDGDGLRTGTGWLQGDDAFLALDRNGNGRIDNGSELFGVDTVLSSGPNAGQNAANGFAALADLDSNHDGLFNALDKQFDSVRLWRDLNQDGLSQADELSTLKDSGITGINLASTATNIALPGGNVQSAAGTYTRSNGQTGSVGDFTTGASGNLDLAQNPFYSTFTAPLPLTAAAQTLPGLHGSGQVRDLREAASLDAALIDDINRMHGTTRTQMMQQVDTLITHWTATSTMPTSISDAAHKGYTLAYLPPGMTPKAINDNCWSAAA